MEMHRHPAPPWEGYTIRQSYFVAAFALFLLLFFMISVAIEQDATAVILATFPIIVSVGLFSFVASIFPRRRALLFATCVTPIFSSMFFVALVFSKISARVNQMDHPSIIIWQLIISYLLLMFAWLFVIHSTRVKSPELHKAQHTHDNHTSRAQNQSHPQQLAQQPQYNSQVNSRVSVSPLQDQTLPLIAPANKPAEVVQQHEHYNQLVEEYANKAKENSRQVAKLQNELLAAQNTLAGKKISALKEEDYRRQITELQEKLVVQKEVAEESTSRNTQYETHIKSFQVIVDRLKDKIDVSDKNFTARLRGIEDKAKAINFVIGRVYSDKNGGNATVRESLNINRELYNAFSEMSAEVSADNKKQLAKVLEAIYGKLVNLELSENKLFKVSSRSKLIRNSHGKDTVLEVLAKNDTDPVLDYFVEAKEICTNMLSYLRR